MPERIAYATNPRSYAQLLAAGVTPAQIRAAINNGLNPSQLPPEYFGLSGGYTPQSVGRGAPSNELGGIDIPPANMVDPYGGAQPNQSNWWDYSPNTSQSVSSNLPPWENPNVSFSMQGPQVDYTQPQFPSESYFPSLGGNMELGGYGGNQASIPYAATMDWPYLESSNQYGVGPINYESYSPNVGQNVVSSPTGLNLYGSPIDWPYLPSSNQYGWQSPDYSQLMSDPSGAGLVGSGSLAYSEPTPLPEPQSDPTTPSSTIQGSNMMSLNANTALEGLPFGAPDWLAQNSWTDPNTGETHYYDANWNWIYSTGTQPQQQSTVDPNGTQVATTQPINPYAGNIVGTDPYTGEPIYGNNPLGNPVINVNAGIPGTSGMYQSGTWIPNNSIMGVNYGQMGYSLMGVPGTFVTTPSGQTYSTAVGMSMHPSGSAGSGTSPPGGWGSLAHPSQDFWTGMGRTSKSLKGKGG